MYFQKKIVHQTAHKKLERYHPNAPRNRPKETVETHTPPCAHRLGLLNLVKKPLYLDAMWDPNTRT